MKKKILIVDDQADIASLLTSVIMRAKIDAKMIICTSLHGAIAALKKDGPFDLVITDFNIPAGNEGAQVTQTAKALYDGIPVIVMSGKMESHGDEIHQLCRADAYLAKPFQMGEIVKATKRLLGLPVPDKA